MKNHFIKGDILVSVLIFAAIAVTVVSGLVNWGAALLVGIRTTAAKEQAFQIAEAGIDYYRWHLAQYPTDYQDGTAASGPYNHSFYDKNNNLIGGYSLSITPPPLGSTKVVITSSGTTTANKNVKRVVQAILAEPSLAQYAVVANDYLRFGVGTVVNGPITSNKGIHFDGIANNVISSAVATYTDPDWDGNANDNNSGGSCTNLSYGVHTCVSPADLTPPSTAANNTTVFAAGRQYPVPAIDFVGLQVNLQTLYNSTLTSGVCSNTSTASCWLSSGSQGYHIVFLVNNGSTTYDMYKVTSQQSTPNSCGPDQYNNPTAYSEMNSGGTQNAGTNWGTWSINGLTGSSNPSSGETQVNGPNADHSWPIPPNGIIFVADNLWVDGTIDNARMTVASANIGTSNPNSFTNITVNTNLKYTNLNGNDVLGLIAQGNVNVGMVSDNSFEIDGALMAENGRVGRFYYDGSCSVSSTNYSSRSSLTLLGMIATAIRYGFAYTDGTGYTNRNITYDANLLYSPPPSFPLASTQYQMASWKQLQ
ncbi:MAG: hypothetical protein P4L61_00010 [Candidatus Pacebacteria bacterium]|nr:hypothetical protein [Candidatus Paceibacterota bacterium]